MDSRQARVAVAAAVVFGTAAALLLKRRGDKSRTVTVSELNVYPVKSCAEVTVDRATATPRGFEHDRVAQVTDGDGKPCTPRDPGKERLFHVRPGVARGVDGNEILRLEAPGVEEAVEVDLEDGSAPVVTAEAMDTPGVKLRDYGDAAAEWLQRATGIAGCRLTGIGDEYDRVVKVNPAQGDPVPEDGGESSPPPPVSLADEAPYLLASVESLRDLNRRLSDRGRPPVDMRRFRPNVVVTGLRPWEEDTWKRIRVGETAEFHVWQRCGRCVMTTIDRDGLGRGPEPLATLSTFRERSDGMRNFGMHMVPVGGMGGVVELGDEVTVLEYDEERRDEWSKLFGS